MRPVELTHTSSPRVLFAIVLLLVSCASKQELIRSAMATKDDFVVSTTNVDPLPDEGEIAACLQRTDIPLPLVLCSRQSVSPYLGPSPFENIAFSMPDIAIESLASSFDKSVLQVRKFCREGGQDWTVAFTLHRSTLEQNRHGVTGGGGLDGFLATVTGARGYEIERVHYNLQLAGPNLVIQKAVGADFHRIVEEHEVDVDLEYSAPPDSATAAGFYRSQAFGDIYFQQMQTLRAGVSKLLKDGFCDPALRRAERVLQSAPDGAHGHFLLAARSGTYQCTMAGAGTTTIHVTDPGKYLKSAVPFRCTY